MKTVDAEIQAAIEGGSSYSSFIYGRVSPSRVFFEDYSEYYPISLLDGRGFPEDALEQEIGFERGSPPPSPTVYTFFNNGGTLNVAQNGSTSSSSLGVSLTGKPGVHSNRLYRISGSNVVRHSISYGPVSLDGGTTVGTLDETGLHVHGVSATRCVVLTDGDGGIRPWVIDNTTVHKAEVRFMFPSFRDYGEARTISNLALYSGALELNGKVFIYLSSVDGSVEAVYWDEDTKEFSDVFTAVPTKLDVSLCEFRIANAYEHGGVAYLAGQFRRSENVEDDEYYSMVLRSADGLAFALDRFSAVTNFGFRFLAGVGDDNYFYLNGCNRVCYTPVVYTLDGLNQNFIYLDLPKTDILRYSGQGDRGRIDLRAGDEQLLFHDYIQEGNRLEMYIGYQTTSGSAGDNFATYIIEQTNSRLADGQRTLSLGLVGEGLWKLQNHTSPFYTEFFGKSSLYDDFTEEKGTLYVGESSGLSRTSFFVDFWQSEPHDDSAQGITGIEIIKDGGVDPYPRMAYDSPVLIGAHKLAFKTKDLKDVLFLKDYPEVTATSINAKLYGWSRAMGSPNTLNDIVELLLVVEHADGTIENFYTNEDTHFPNTHPSSAAGEDPITVTMTGLTVGDKIKAIGMVFESTQSSQFCPARVELLDGITMAYNFEDPNTGWDFIEDSDTGGLQIPGVGRPYTMFAQKPFDAKNFSIAACFTHGVQGPISTYPTAVGLVGLAENSDNLVMGRYNRSNNQLEIVKVRAGLESVLTFGTPTSGSPAGDVDLMFTHRDGHFELLMPSGGTWNKELEYDWLAADGWMYTSETVSKKCGIYGYLAAPSFRITGLKYSSTDDLANVDGIAHLPLESITDFPTSGKVSIGDSVYSYTAKQAAATILRGPYQVRQNGLYTTPYGDGYGLENRDFNWTAATSLVNNRLLGLSSGNVYRIRSSSGALWKIFIKTGGVTYYLYNRARFYSDNTKVGSIYVSTTMKSWVTGGLIGISKVSGPSATHAEGDLCQLYMDGTVTCNWFYGAGGDDDITIEDLITKISAHAGVQALFPGDVYRASQSIAGGYVVGIVDYREGFDLRFRAPSSTAFTLKASASDPRQSGDTDTEIALSVLGGGAYRLTFSSQPSDTVIEQVDFEGLQDGHIFRVIYHDNFATVYMDGRWIHTFAVPELVYANDVYVTLTGAMTVTDLLLQELSDWREAIYVDLETDALSAINSVIQERPLENASRYDGSIAYWYELNPVQITQMIDPRQHDFIEQTPRDGASDGIVYASDEVSSIQHLPYLENYGFATKVMRFPNLKSGALKAAKYALTKAYQNRIQHTATIRPDVRLEIGDILVLNYTTNPTETVITRQIIIDNLSVNYTSGQSQMTVQGRENL